MVVMEIELRKLKKSIWKGTEKNMEFQTTHILYIETLNFVDDLLRNPKITKLEIKLLVVFMFLQPRWLCDIKKYFMCFKNVLKCLYSRENPFAFVWSQKHEKPVQL